MRKTIIVALIAFYLSLLFLFFLLFIEDSPFKKNHQLLKLQDVFSIGWNFFTKGPKEDLTKIFFYKNNVWVELTDVSFYSKFTKQKDAVQTEVSGYVASLPDSLWSRFSCEESCMNDTTTLNPKNNYTFVKEIINKYHSKNYIISNYSEYFLIVVEKKMPWAWLMTYSQKKMKCKRLILKL
ncbi:MAG: hypothetical protein Q7W45_01905 [Bacteroidota bacterium]|nr:hypothetical protein [Bacteroidota bacterium]MDP3146589.1 hypothetical protein [Bacteroidota bacterium]